MRIYHFASSPALGILLLLSALVATNVALAQGPRGGGPPPAPPVPDVDKESLIFSIPDKWYPFSRATANKDETFMFPTGQNPEDWVQSLRVEQYFSNLGVASAQQVYDMKISANADACDNHEVTPMRDQPENGYSMTL